MQFEFVAGRPYWAGTLAVRTVRIDWCTERLPPGEVAPMFERRTTHCTYPCEGRATSWFIVMFGRRLIVDFSRRDR